MSVNVALVRIEQEDLDWLRNPDEGDEEQEERMDAWFWNDHPGSFELDKAYARVHFLLTGEDEEGEGPLAFLCDETFGESVAYEFAYGPGRVLNHEQVGAVAAAVSQVSSLQLQARLANPKILAVYPPTSEDRLSRAARDELLTCVKDLAAFMQAAAAERAMVLVACL